MSLSPKPARFPRRSRSISSCLGISTEQGVCLAASWWNGSMLLRRLLRAATADAMLQPPLLITAIQISCLCRRYGYLKCPLNLCRPNLYGGSSGYLCGIASGRAAPYNTAYLVMVALDAKGNPAPVPPLQIETEEQKLEYEAAALRKELRKKRRAQGY